MLRMSHHRIMQVVIVIGHVAAMLACAMFAWGNFSAFVYGVTWGATMLMNLHVLELKRRAKVYRFMKMYLVGLIVRCVQ